ncbi:D-2-hydroxyacid dehydrogenase [Thalassobaculum sp.]|uniref:D-2-hydroxyacid dehydrogenase n=1 Tax=Thalassobaculum sp. TaxID=2022740 RepID=UPI0032EE8CCB
MTDKPLLVLWIDNADPYREALAEAGLADRVEVAVVPMAEPMPADLAARVSALVAWRSPPGALAAMPRLRWLQAMSAGVEMWLGRPDLRDDLVLTAARGVHRVSMPENILAALFHLTKPIVAAALDQRDSRWTRRVSVPLAGKTLGILGIGTIGAELARKAAALEIRVIGTRRSGVAVPGVDEVFTPDRTDHVLAAADFVLLLLPSTPDTRDFMNAGRLSAMRPDAYLLNFGRGDAVVDADLVAAVRDGTIAGAVLDVFRQEPLPAEHPFWTTPGISVWPHVGGLHPYRDALVAELLAENLRRFLAGETLSQSVDRVAGY